MIVHRKNNERLFVQFLFNESRDEPTFMMNETEKNLI